VPKTLRDRCQPDSIREFHAAARERFLDGVSLSASDRRTAAVYLWGYVAEMTLKAAYFRFLGFAEDRHVTFQDLQNAVARGRSLGIGWPQSGWGHNVRAWAELLVNARASVPGQAYPSTRLGAMIQRTGQRLERIWSETLRYHKNVAYPYEVNQARDAARWFLLHARQL